MRKLSFFILFLLITTSLLAKNYYVSSSIVNLQEEPKNMSEVVSQAIYATAINVLKEQGEWLFIQTPDQCKGWILKNFAIAKKDEYLTKGIRARIKSFWAHIQYVQDTTPYPPIITLPFEAEIEVISPKEELSNRWVKVRLIDGQTGFAQSRDLDFELKILSPDEMIEFSKNFLNIPYYWGGTSCFGYDCSGFIQMLYRQMGISFPRNSREQAADPRLEEVKFEELQKGDLVFFNSSSSVKISHVGMYLEDGKIIHAVTVNFQPKVQITKIAPYRMGNDINVENFVTARRLKNI